MLTAIDQAKPWFTPRRTLAATIQPHEGASMIMNGTGTPTTHPATSSLFLPKRSTRLPTARLESAFTTPKETMNERMAVLVTSPKTCEPSSGTTVRSSPTAPPTKALIRTKSENWRQFSLSPRRTEDDEGLSAMRASLSHLACGAAVGAGLQLRGIAFRLFSRSVEFHDALVVFGSRRSPARYLLNETLLVLD